MALTGGAVDMQGHDVPNCFDYEEYDEVVALTYLNEDPSDNIVIVKSDAYANPYCWKRSRMADLLKDASANFYECSGPSPIKGQLYVGISLPDMMLMPVEQVRAVFTNPAVVWKVEATDRVLERTGSKDAMDNLQYVSGHHCQEGTSKRVFSFTPLGGAAGVAIYEEGQGAASNEDSKSTAGAGSNYEYAQFQFRAALIVGNPDAIEQALVLPAVHPDEDDNEALVRACARGWTRVAQMLLDMPLDKGVDAGARDNSPLVTACANGHTDIVKLLLDLPMDRGVKPGARDNYAILTACHYGHMAIVKLLLDLPLDRGVKPGARNNYALKKACARGQLDVVKLLLDLPMSRGIDPAGALTLACATGDWEIVNLLLDRGADPAEEFNYPILNAATFGHTAVVKLLLSLPLGRGVNPNARDALALTIACKGGYFRIVELLLPRITFPPSWKLPSTGIDPEIRAMVEAAMAAQRRGEADDERGSKRRRA